MLDPNLSSSLTRRRSGARKDYCFPCKKRRVKCDGLKPICVRCQRNTRSHECLYEDDLTRPASTSGSSTPNIVEHDGPDLYIDDTFSIEQDLLFETVFHVKWLPSSILLIRSPDWTSAIVDAQISSPELASAVCAMGALKVAHAEGSSRHYQRALTGLKQKLQQAEDSCYTTEVCVAIILMVCYEMVSGKVNGSYGKHLDGIAAILKYQVRYMSARKIEGPSSKLAFLLYSSLRNIETTEASLQQTKPRLTHREWRVLLPPSVFIIREDYERDIGLSMMNLCAELTARGIVTDEIAIRGLLVTLEKNIDRLPYLRHQREVSSQDARLRRLITCDTANPFTTDIMIDDLVEVNRGFRMCIAAKMFTVKLQLQLHLPETSHKELIQASETLIRLVYSMIALAESLGGRFMGWAWCVYALFNTQRAFHKAGVSDARAIWGERLLELALKFLHS